jgi:hypothetical protein
MKLRQYKKLQIKTINQIKDDEILVVRFDMDKIKPETIGKFMKMIYDKTKCKSIALPIDANIDTLSIKVLESIRDGINREIESR